MRDTLKSKYIKQEFQACLFYSFIPPIMIFLDSTCQAKMNECTSKVSALLGKDKFTPGDRVWLKWGMRNACRKIHNVYNCLRHKIFHSL